MYSVYLATCLSTRKQYVGISNNYLRRKRDHFYCARSNESNTPFYNAIRKYGEDSFLFEQIDYCASWSSACLLEVFYIKELQTISPNGYNLTLGGEGAIHCEETKKKLSLMAKGRRVSDETKAKLRKFGIEQCNDENHRKEMLDLTIKYWSDRKAREKQSRLKKKQFIDHPEMRIVASENSKIRFANPIERERLAFASRKYWADPENRKKQCQLKKQQFIDHPKMKEKARKRTIGYFLNHPEAKQQRRIQMKKYYSEHPELREKLMNARKEARS